MEAAAKAGIPGLLVGAELDRIADPVEVEELAAITGWDFILMLDGGHSVPIEQPRKWRNIVENFLSSSL